MNKIRKKLAGKNYSQVMKIYNYKSKLDDKTQIAMQIWKTFWK